MQKIKINIFFMGLIIIGPSCLEVVDYAVLIFKHLMSCLIVFHKLI